jgi:hypothetical protein
VDIHPFAASEIARLHREEKLARSLAAYAAVQAREEGKTAGPRAERASDGRLRFVGRLRWRQAGARGPSRPAI